MKRRLAVLLAVLATAISTSAFVTTPAHAATTHHTVAQAKAYALGKYYGANSYTDWGRATISGWSTWTSCTNHVTYTEPTVTMKQYPNPLVTSPLSDQNGLTTTTGMSTSAAQPDATCQAVPLGMVQPDSWWNPASWSWGKILGNTWNSIWNNCLSGAVQGFAGTASGVLIVNLMLRGGKLFVGPAGYAAIAIGGCVVDLLW